MDKNEVQAVIKNFVKKGLVFTDIHEGLHSTSRYSSPSCSTSKKWADEIKRGRTSIQDDERLGRAKTTTTKEIVLQIHNAD